MGKEIGRSFKYNRTKISSPTLKKPVLSSSANHTSYTTNSTPTFCRIKFNSRTVLPFKTNKHLKYRWYPLLLNTPEKNISVQATTKPPRLTPLITTLTLLPVELPKTTHLPPLGEEYLWSIVQQQLVQQLVVQQVIVQQWLVQR